MAMVGSGSSSSRIKRNYYDVFVSFRGEDTRSNFTDHLFGALKRKGIVAFRDDTKLEKGESIAPELEKAIEESEVLIVVLSKNYAFSTWCLQELVLILDYVDVSGKHVLPVFYDVDPSEVRKQKRNYEKASDVDPSEVRDYEKAFAEHEERFKDDPEKLVEVQKWREALTQVANLSGWHIKDKPQYALIEEIVGKIINILGHKLSRLPNDLVGMQSPLEELAELLHLGSVDDVRVVGISGMCGIGKTTLATVLYGRISHLFDACCFIDDVSKIYQESGPVEVQKQLLYQTLEEEKLQICNHYNATNLIQRRLCNLRTLIVLDNVDHVEQLEKLALNRERLGAGSRIIIISRDGHILKEYPVDEVYNVQPLERGDSSQLFCGKAFKSHYIKEGYGWFVHDALTYVDGHPLAIKVLGSFLFDRDVNEWRSALSRLRENPSKDIMDVLRLSFDGLENYQKEIFLDIACFFQWGRKEYVKKVLNCCGFSADIGISVLFDKSLITYYDNVDGVGVVCIGMHLLLQELGRKIVQEKWSRLWLSKLFHNVMSKNLENNVEAIVLSKDYFVETGLLKAETLSKMSRLRLLILDRAYFSGSLDCLSNELRYVEWGHYHFKYLPSNFQPNQLVTLILKYSNIKELWEGKKDLPNLRELVLSHSKNLIKMPDFGEVPNLERLDLEGCVKLVHIDPSIGLLKELTDLNLQDCKSLVSIPINILGLKSLEYLNLSGCSKVSIKPMHAEHLKKLDTSETMLHPRSKSPILKFTKLLFNLLSPKARKDLCSASCLTFSFPGFSCLLELDISFCNLRQIPDAIGYMCCLERLNLSGNHFVEMPSLRELSQLTYLKLEHCKQLKYLPELPSHSKLHLARRLHIWKTEAGIYIFNCPKLHKREHCSSMTISWMMQTIQHASQESFEAIEIVIPGGEIPRWFSHQSVGNSISIDPSPILYDNNCIGLACCVIFVPRDDPTTLSYENYNYIYIYIWSGSKLVAQTAVVVNSDPAMSESNHMWLIYIPRETYFRMVGSRYRETHGFDHIKFVSRASYKPGWHLEVKNLAYRWVCKQDLELFDVTTMHGRDSSTLNRKFLAIEDEAQAQP